MTEGVELRQRRVPGVQSASSGQDGSFSSRSAGRPHRVTLPPSVGAPYVVIGAFVLMAVCLLFSNPPGASPDEEAHYLRAMGAAHGQLMLERPEPQPPAPPEIARQREWMWMQSGVVELPEKYSPAPFECWAHPSYLGSCDRTAPSSERPATFDTYVGSYPPFAYLLPGLFMRAADEPRTALMLGRAGVLLASLGLIAAAVLALYRPKGRLWLAGILCAVTPMVLITAASLSSSGIEIAAAICFFACLLRLTRSSEQASPAPRWIWVMAAVSGATMAVARDLGPIWVVLHVGLVIMSVGWSRAQGLWSRAGSSRWIFLGLMLVSFAAALGWRAVAAVPPDMSGLRFPDFTLEEAEALVRQMVGVFGALDAQMPVVAYRVWGGLLAALVLAALLSGSVLQRLALGTAVLAVVVVTYALEAVQNIHGFGMQTRHVMPAVICIPLLAGDMIAGGTRRRWAGSRLAMPALAVVASAVHFTAWHTLGRRFAVGGQGPLIFVWDPVWSPPGGWIAWAVVMSLACLVLVLPFIADPRKEELSH